MPNIITNNFCSTTFRNFEVYHRRLGLKVWKNGQKTRFFPFFLKKIQNYCINFQCFWFFWIFFYCRIRKKNFSYTIPCSSTRKLDWKCPFYFFPWNKKNQKIWNFWPKMRFSSSRPYTKLKFGIRASFGWTKTSLYSVFWNLEFSVLEFLIFFKKFWNFQNY
jgi:hypothetical protein